MTPTVEETHQIKIVDFQYTTDEMQRINAAAFNDGNCVDDGGRYDWRAGSSITVWVLPDTEANKRENAIKAIFYTHPGAHDPLSTEYLKTLDEISEHMKFNDNKFSGVHYNAPYTYDDALTELGILEQRALGRVFYGRV